MALSAYIPLADIFPWSIHEPSTIVIVNSSAAAVSSNGNLVDVDGRFLLYQIISNVLSSSSSSSGRARDATSSLRQLSSSIQRCERRPKSCRVFWLSSKPVTPRHVVNGLNRIGLTNAEDLLAEAPPRATAAAKISNTNAPRPSPESHHPILVVRSVLEELGAAIRKQESLHYPTFQSPSLGMDRVEFVKREIYGSIRDWVSRGEAPMDGMILKDGEGDACAASSWIVLDDVDTLGALLGERLVSGLVQSVQALAVSRNVGLVMHCCSSDDENSEDVGGGAVGGRWVGASGGSRGNRFEGDEVQLAPLLAEFADYIVDVCPLQSGPTREAHGRLVLTTTRDMTSSHFNYCLADNRATAIRIQQHPRR